MNLALTLDLLLDIEQHQPVIGYQLMNADTSHIDSVVFDSWYQANHIARNLEGRHDRQFWIVEAYKEAS